jgi:DNA mismatch repair protein MutS
MRRPPAETPLMRQYLEIKDQHPESVLFFRLGDFYEMFFEDAVLASRLLDLTLTTRDKGKEDAVPMCGVPHHAARGYVARLVELGHKVVICEQVEDPRQAKGIVRREVVRIVTPGVILDEEALEARAPRYLAAVVPEGAGFGLAYLDVTPGEFRATSLGDVVALGAELGRVDPRELLVGREALTEGGALASLALLEQGRLTLSHDPPPDLAAARELLARALAEDVQAWSPAIACAAAWVVSYARATQPGGALPLTRLQRYAQAETLVLDDACVQHLELLRTIVGGKREGSLLHLLDETRTAPGGRLLRRWLLFPLTDVTAIRRRQDAVELLVEQAALRAELRACLAEIYDLERLAGRVKLGAAQPRDLAALRRSLDKLPELARILGTARQRVAPELLELPGASLAELAGIAAEIAAVLVDDPPAQGGTVEAIRPGASAEIDELRGLAAGGKDGIAAIEERERGRTGIGSLKIRYNRVFGYYIEITRSNLKAVPADYVRKQTLANAERYVTPDLAELEAKVLGAEERLETLTSAAFAELRRRVGDRLPALARAAEQVATLDVLAGLAEVAHLQGWCRPLVDEGERLDLEDGRHPVVERLAAAGGFVANHCTLDPRDAQLVILTGPNMAGKSTYMRQVAVAALLAQIGSNVPARRAHLGIVDRIFTRVGAADNLAAGESTFMVEMRETAQILASATRRSLIILDEIGRGTSTYDGVSIAFAVAEYLHDVIGAKTLFATHYHELTVLATRRPRVRNMSVAVREHAGEVVFLHRVVDGPASRSYGIEVARLAGLPRSVLGRARQLLAALESRAGGQGSPPPGATDGPDHGAPPPPGAALLAELADLDTDQMTPLEALQTLAALRRRERSGSPE